MNWLEFFAGADWARGGEMPIYERLVSLVRDGIESGQLPDKQKLPTNRQLAGLLGVDRSTVARAYLELEQKGLVESHVGRGTFVRVGGTGMDAGGPAPHDMSFFWSEKFSRASQTAFAMFGRQAPQPQLSEDLISFAGGIPTQEFFPKGEFQEIVRRLSGSGRIDDMFAYSPAEGHPALRREVRHHLKLQGMDVADEELLIVSGSQQGIDVVAKTFVDPGDVVLIEEPSYFWANCIFSSSQARCLPVPLDEGGLRLDALETVVRRQPAKLLYVMPTFQNPTGVTMPMDRRRRLLELAARHQLPVFEDNFVGDLRYGGEELPSLKELDGGGKLVIHQGTFSKALCPGLRLGWLVAPAEAMGRLRLAKRACDLSTSSMAQAIMAEYLHGGQYTKHLRTVREAYRARLDAMCAALERHLGHRVKWLRPEGGLFIWLRLPEGSSGRELLACAERRGVTFSPGDTFFLHGEHADSIRLSFIQLDARSIEEGVSRLAQALDEYTANRLRLLRHGGAASGEMALI